MGEAVIFPLVLRVPTGEVLLLFGRRRRTNSVTVKTRTPSVKRAREALDLVVEFDKQRVRDMEARTS